LELESESASELVLGLVLVLVLGLVLVLVLGLVLVLVMLALHLALFWLL
jgi:hypothetical protein